MDLLKAKDGEINSLNREIGEIKSSLNMLSQETSDLDLEIRNNTDQINVTKKSVHRVDEKTIDLEDRSRRLNLIFFQHSRIKWWVRELRGKD